MAVARERLGKHVPAATGTHATIEELLETAFSMQSVPRLYKDHSFGLVPPGNLLQTPNS
jgi:hypothetical protein